jgi:hypothetical protein
MKAEKRAAAAADAMQTPLLLQTFIFRNVLLK